MKMAKRLFDCVCALIGLTLLSPILVLLYFILFLSSGHPVIFSQLRVGRNKKLFKCHKFRTMKIGAPNVATHEISENVITPIGHTLRRYKIDEIPQLWNVLVGDMSLVGPRPCLPNQDELICERDKRQVFSISPGITGLAQVRGVDMIDPSKLADIDQFYISRQSLVFDFKIIFNTLIRR
ncbi:lipid carrier : UDP-N-acetylgalactosaminyltransferase [Ahrensia marina]|uniref:Lipid carrier: UDP-N-acetylgalactosaminyltransferase n=2 Tax=Ahrensia marina TaxID=1514904 RepID=A0A0N1J6A2_9HYPH|nr:lipid carrier : UDP-N-acetylgalactosaminyltransferase [Ahrensia marina]